MARGRGVLGLLFRRWDCSIAAVGTCASTKYDVTDCILYILIVLPNFPRADASGTSPPRPDRRGRCAMGGGGPSRHGRCAGACKRACGEMLSCSGQPAVSFLHQRDTPRESGTSPPAACQRTVTHVHAAQAVQIPYGRCVEAAGPTSNHPLVPSRHTLLFCHTTPAFKAADRIACCAHAPFCPTRPGR